MIGYKLVAVDWKTRKAQEQELAWQQLRDKVEQAKLDIKESK